MAELSALDDLVDETTPVGVAVAGEDGSVRTRAWNVANESRFQAASISKPVAAVAALSLVAEGVLGLDDDLAPLLRSWVLPSVGDWRSVLTLRNLLTHSAGLTVHGFPGYVRTDDVPSLVDILDGRGNTPAVCVDIVPGVQSRYSGGGFVVVQLLVEDLTGRPFADVVTERVLGPAAMMSSGYAEPPNPAPAQSADGSVLPGGPRLHPELAAAGLWSTAGDLVRFALAIQSSALLPAELNQELLTEQMPGWGLGIQLLAGNAFGHGGANAGYRCQLLAARDGAWAAAVMTASDAGTTSCLSILNHLGSTEPLTGWEPLPEAQDSVELLAGAVGEYRDAVGRAWRLSGGLDTGLSLEVGAQPPLRLAVAAIDRCLLPGLDAELALMWDDRRVSALELRQAGLTTRAHRAADPHEELTPPSPSEQARD